MADLPLAVAVPRVEKRADAPPTWAIAFVRGGGVGLLVYGIAGAVFNGSRLASYLDLSPLEDSIHIVFALMMLYAGFVQPTARMISRTLTLIGIVSLLVGLLGPISAESLIPSSLTHNGVVDGAWAVAHHVIHVVAGIANLAVAYAVARPRLAAAS